ncbi:RCC1 domain-containing protein [Clostridioides difficile]|uniref:RCC1 domain-containing protein n=1 Tax=Clostridioides difficile TaxID=1496 RepID=UPI0023584194|nr:RCC1 domain-containing protein [Clostridioides difficile]MDC9456684.1 RCC1 domain-containing protein [Clostridioides difficile]
MIVCHVSDVKHVSCGDNFTYFIKSDDSLWSIGKNSEYQLGIGHNNLFYLWLLQLYTIAMKKTILIIR